MLVSKRVHPRETVTNECIHLLHMYRSRSSSYHSNGQLVLPEAMKLLPLFLNSLYKQPAFRDKVDTRTEDAIVSLHALWRMPSCALMATLYPVFYPLVDLPRSCGTTVTISPHRGLASPDGVYMPSNVPCSGFRATAKGAYLIEAGSALYLWLGAEVPSSWVQDVYGAECLADADLALRPRGDPAALPDRIIAMVDELRARRTPGPCLPLRTVLPNTSDEAQLCTLLVEDAILGEQSYVNYLCDIHAAIQQKAEASVW